MWLFVTLAATAGADDARRLIEVRVNSCARIPTDQVPMSASVTDSEVATPPIFGPSDRVCGRRVGTTDMAVLYSDGRFELFDIRVHRDPREDLATTPYASTSEPRPLVDLGVGEFVSVIPPRLPSAVTITDPEIVEAIVLGLPNKIQLQGLKPGTTDILLEFGDVAHMLVNVSVHRDLQPLGHTLTQVTGLDPLADTAPRAHALREHR